MGTNAVSDSKPEDDVSLEACEHDGDGLIPEKGSTSVDAADMSRMGKKQELVRATSSRWIHLILTIPAPQLQIRRNRRFRHYPSGHMGECASCELVRLVQWRHCW